MRRVATALVCLAVSMLSASAASAAMVEIAAEKDNSLYEEGDLSNALGEYLFTGNIAFPEGISRRALIKFDVAGNVPAGATITDVSLTLNMSKTIVGAFDVSVHRLSTDWGEATSNAPGEEGAGTAATAGDATWLHTSFPGDFWASAGGDFVPAASATISVTATGPYTWMSPQLLADVQDMYDNPADNHGWILIGDESTSPTAKRWDSRENDDPVNHPMLVVEFTGGDVPASSPWGLALLVMTLLCISAIVLRYRTVRAN